MIWSPEAQETFDKNLDYLQEEWSDKEAATFVRQTEQIIGRLKVFPEAYPQGKKSKNYRRVRLNKYIVLFYRYFRSKQRRVLLSFWNVKQDPAKLKY